MLRCGLLGEALGHSYSPAIHALLADYDYRLYERAPDKVPLFLKSGEWDGLNVTIPYKKTVVPFCDELSETAKRLGSVNTIVRRADGTLYGDNTDWFGFADTVRRSGASPAGKKALVLGSGGASVTVCAVLRDLGARVTVISRSGGDNYENLSRHADAALIANATPVGMYPKNGEAPLDLAQFPRLEGVFDLIYNPARTALLLQAEALGIPHWGGLHMLVAQAAQSCARFTGDDGRIGEIDRVERALRLRLQNIALIGMPGCGKSTVAAALGARLGMPVLEADEAVERAAGKPIPTIFAEEGEAGFRARETAVLRELGKRSGAILSTGGGCVTRAENYPLLHQNSRIVLLRRSLDRLPKEGRPLSQQNDLRALYEQRRAQYARFADFAVDNDGSVEETVERIAAAL